MSLKDRIESDYKQSFKEGNKTKVDVLRLLKAAVKNEEIRERKKFEDHEVLTVVIKQAKQRKDSIEAYQKGGRADLVQREQEQIKVLNEYLPAQLSEDELRDIIQEIIKKLAASGPADFGRVMKEVVARVRGQADGQLVAKIVKEELTPPAG
jgi:uncharacterized protein YqeY